MLESGNGLSAAEGGTRPQGVASRDEAAKSPAPISAIELPDKGREASALVSQQSCRTRKADALTQPPSDSLQETQMTQTGRQQESELARGGAAEASAGRGDGSIKEPGSEDPSGRRLLNAVEAQSPVRRELDDTRSPEMAAQEKPQALARQESGPDHEGLGQGHQNAGPTLRAESQDPNTQRVAPSPSQLAAKEKPVARGCERALEAKEAEASKSVGGEVPQTDIDEKHTLLPANGKPTDQRESHCLPQLIHCYFDHPCSCVCLL